MRPTQPTRVASIQPAMHGKSSVDATGRHACQRCRTCSHASVDATDRHARHGSARQRCRTARMHARRHARNQTHSCAARFSRDARFRCHALDSVHLLWTCSLGRAARQARLKHRFSRSSDCCKTAQQKIDQTDRKSTRLNSSHITRSRMPSSA